MILPAVSFATVFLGTTTLASNGSDMGFGKRTIVCTLFTLPRAVWQAQFLWGHLVSRGFEQKAIVAALAHTHTCVGFFVVREVQWTGLSLSLCTSFQGRLCLRSALHWHVLMMCFWEIWTRQCRCTFFRLPFVHCVNAAIREAYMHFSK